MQLSEFNEVKDFLNELNIETSFRDVCENIIAEETDFEVDGFRFIDQCEIDKIQSDELESDPYILGCFTAWFIADNTDLSLSIVEALQEGEKYEQLGQHIIDNGYVNDMQEAYSQTDGYGHHFAHYDHNEHEMPMVNNGQSYLVFRTH